MNRFEKAAEFGAMMGKRAADFNTKIQGNTSLGSGPSSPQQNKLTLPPSAGPYGGPANKVGTLPSASTTQRVPQLGTSQKLKIHSQYNPTPRPPSNTIGGANPSGIPKELSKNPGGTSQDNNYINFLNTNYSRMGNPNNPNQLVPPGLGTSRQQFHTSLGTQLDDNGANSNPLNSNYSKWSKRMGEIAKDTSEQSPISHYILDQPSDLNNWPRGEGSARLSGMPAHAGSRLPSAYYPTRDESGKYLSGPNMAPAGQYSYVPKNDTPTNKLMEWATGMPKTITNPNMTRAHENVHSGWQNQEGGLQFTDRQGKPVPPNPKGTFYAGNPMLPHMVSAEAGAVFSEIGQGARAFKDVTGKNMEGDYNFSPEVSMSNRELGEYAKKYKPTDLNSPAGQLFMRRILETSK
jgi:hypothetical protein